MCPLPAASLITHTPSRRSKDYAYGVSVVAAVDDPHIDNGSSKNRGGAFTAIHLVADQRVDLCLGHSGLDLLAFGVCLAVDVFTPRQVAHVNGRARVRTCSTYVAAGGFGVEQLIINTKTATMRTITGFIDLPPVPLQSHPACGRPYQRCSSQSTHHHLRRSRNRLSLLGNCVSIVDTKYKRTDGTHKNHDKSSPTRLP